MVLISILISCWSLWWVGIIPRHLLIAIDEIFNWVLFATLFYLLTSSMPLFLQKNLIRVVSLTNSCTEWISGSWLRLKNIRFR